MGYEHGPTKEPDLPAEIRSKNEMKHEQRPFLLSDGKQAAPDYAALTSGASQSQSGPITDLRLGRISRRWPNIYGLNKSDLLCLL